MRTLAVMTALLIALAACSGGSSRDLVQTGAAASSTSTASQEEVKAEQIYTRLKGPKEFRGPAGR